MKAELHFSLIVRHHPLSLLCHASIMPSADLSINLSSYSSPPLPILKSVASNVRSSCVRNGKTSQLLEYTEQQDTNSVSFPSSPPSPLSPATRFHNHTQSRTSFSSLSSRRSTLRRDRESDRLLGARAHPRSRVHHPDEGFETSSQ